MHRFIIDDKHTDGRAYEVRVYPNRRAYVAACNRRQPGEAHYGSQATCFNERRLFFFSPRGGFWLESPIVGAIYLHEEMLDGEIITHETLHAALSLYRTRHRGHLPGRGSGTSVSDGEEELCHTAGRLAQAIADKMWQLKVWTRRSAVKR